MSLFFKDPKTCANPWYGLAVIALVCGVVMLTLEIGKIRYESSLSQRRATANRVVPVGFNKSQRIPSDNRLRF